MKINWYPGHMTKAMRMIEENLPLADVIIYVLDARAPYSCINPNFNEAIAGKPIIYVLNKAELGSVSRVKEWVEYLTDRDSTALSITATAPKSTAPIVPLIKKMCGKKLEKYRAKGVRKSLKAMILGVPNTGKSTLINNLCGRKKTVTGNRPGVTRGMQWVRINEYLEVLDTPGTLYPKLSDQRVARRLAFLGSIRDEVVDSAELTYALVDELNAVSPSVLSTRYGTDCTGKSDEVVRAVALARGFKMRGGEVDYERTAAAILDDFRKGRMGAITLDSVDEIGEKG